MEAVPPASLRTPRVSSAVSQAPTPHVAPASAAALRGGERLCHVPRRQHRGLPHAPRLRFGAALVLRLPN